MDADEPAPLSLSGIFSILQEMGFGGLFALAGLAVIWLSGLAPMGEWLDSRDWVETTCAVEQSWIVEVESDDDVNYKVHVRYDFSAGEVAMRGDRVALSGSTFSSAGRARVMAAHYGKGTTHPCWYDFWEPEQSTLNRDFSMSWLVVLPFGLIFALPGAWMMWDAFFTWLAQIRHVRQPKPVGRKEDFPFGPGLRVVWDGDSWSCSVRAGGKPLRYSLLAGGLLGAIAGIVTGGIVLSAESRLPVLPSPEATGLVVGALVLAIAAIQGGITSARRLDVRMDLEGLEIQSTYAGMFQMRAKSYPFGDLLRAVRNDRSVHLRLPGKRSHPLPTAALTNSQLKWLVDQINAGIDRHKGFRRELENSSKAREDLDDLMDR